MSNNNIQEQPPFWHTIVLTFLKHLLIIPGFISLILLRKRLGINAFQYIGEEKENQVPSGLRRRLVMPISAGFFTWLFAKTLMLPIDFYLASFVTAVAYYHLIRWEMSDKNTVEPSSYLGYGHYAPKMYISMFKKEGNLQNLCDFSNIVEIVAYSIAIVVAFFFNGFLCFALSMTLFSISVRVHGCRERRINIETTRRNHRFVDDARIALPEKEDSSSAEAIYLK